MRKILSVLLSALLLIAIIPMSASAETNGYYTYEISDGEVTITDVDESVSGHVAIPSALGGYPVTAIGDYAFYCYGIESITIPESITNIGRYAFFRCSTLETITVNENNAFYSSEDGVLFNKTKTELVQYPEGKFLTVYSIPDGMKRICGSAFSCSTIRFIIIPETVTDIEHGAFALASFISHVFYAGTEAQWNEISISDNNEYLTNSTIHFNSCEDSFSAVVTEPSCKNPGFTAYTCSVCGDIFNYDYVYWEGNPDLKGHIDDNLDNICDRCNEDLIKDCSHICHKSGFMGFIWMIARIFMMIFGINSVCECGVAHY